MNTYRIYNMEHHREIFSFAHGTVVAKVEYGIVLTNDKVLAIIKALG